MNRTLFITTALTCLSLSHVAHADWLQDIFTFREEQKPRVAPNNVAIPPVTVISPYYNQQDAAMWSRYYTRQDIEAIPYMEGSASYVMRTSPRANIPDSPPWGNDIMIDAPRAPNGLPPGYEQLLWRDFMNRQQQREREQTYIGEPGTSPWQPLDMHGRVGKKTIVGEPVSNWQDEMPDRGDYITPRPGDFNYRTPNQRNEGYTVSRMGGGDGQGIPGDHTFGGNGVNSNDPNLVMQGQEVTRSSDMPPAGSQGMRDLPDNYIVEQGDTLSGISEKDQIYGNWKMWPLIFDANRNQIRDPDLIHPRQNLGIPRDYTSQQRGDAINRAQQKRPPYLYTDGQ